jgi:hypothetical protein
MKRRCGHCQKFNGFQHTLCQFFNKHDKRKAAMRYHCPLAYFLKTIFVKLIHMIMKQQLHFLYERFWNPMKKWIRSIVKGRDDDDNNFSHPFAIF